MEVLGEGSPPPWFLIILKKPWAGASQKGLRDRGPCQPASCQAQSSFTLHWFWCPKGYAMNNPDEPPCIHASQMQTYPQSNFERAHGKMTISYGIQGCLHTTYCLSCQP